MEWNESIGVFFCVCIISLGPTEVNRHLKKQLSEA